MNYTRCTSYNWAQACLEDVSNREIFLFAVNWFTVGMKKAGPDREVVLAAVSNSGRSLELIYFRLWTHDKNCGIGFRKVASLTPTCWLWKDSNVFGKALMEVRHLIQSGWLPQPLVSVAESRSQTWLRARHLEASATS